MDHRRFDDLARTAAAPRTRRGFLGAVAALGAGLLAARDAGAQQPPTVITQAYCGTVRCRSNPSKCRAGCVCCVYSNGNSRCVPPGQCGGGGVVVGGSNTQGTCPTGANVCVDGAPTFCNDDSCVCVRTAQGGTACTLGDSFISEGCSTDAECVAANNGAPAVCAALSGGFCGDGGTACVVACPSANS